MIELARQVAGRADSGLGVPRGTCTVSSKSGCRHRLSPLRAAFRPLEHATKKADR